MPDAELAKLIGNIKALLESLEDNVERGRVPTDTLAAIKSSVDEVRLRLWAIMSAASSGEYENFVQRFRLRRATEICRGLATDIEAGSAGSGHAEFKPLEEAARSLIWAINPGA
ncbi:MAG: hypothetical protein ABI836_00910 [Gemmatimonadota bacterium]